MDSELSLSTGARRQGITMNWSKFSLQRPQPPRRRQGRRWNTIVTGLSTVSYCKHQPGYPLINQTLIIGAAWVRWGDGGRGIKTVSATFSKNVIVNSVKRDKQRGQLSRTNKEGNCHGQIERATFTDKHRGQLSRTNKEGNCHGQIKRATVTDK